MIDTLRSAAHLQREIGDELFAVLVNSDNTAAVREFAQKLAESTLPTEMTLGGVTYDILSFLRGEKSVKGDTMVARAKEGNAHLGKEDGEYLLAHQADIPVALRGKVSFVFTNWPRPDFPGFITIVYWNGDRWVQYWRWLGDDWNGDYRVLRRKS